VPGIEGLFPGTSLRTRPIKLLVGFVARAVESFEFKPVRAVPIAIFMRECVWRGGVGRAIRPPFATAIHGNVWVRLRIVTVSLSGSLCLPVPTMRRGEPER